MFLNFESGGKMGLKIYFSHSLKGSDMKIVQVLSNLALDYGVEMIYQPDTQPKI